MEIQVIHDYVTQKGGAERVAATLAEELGDGRLTTSVYLPEKSYDVFRELQITELTPWAPDIVKASRAMLAPVAALGFSRYRPDADGVICSSSGWSHWIQTDSPTVVYCHTPPRWLWAPDDYFAGLPQAVRNLVQAAMIPIRRKDIRNALKRTRYIANSTVARDRIREAYGIDAEIVFPPVSLERNGPKEPDASLEPGYFLLIARPRGYKNTQALVRLFEERDVGTLVIVGGEAEPERDGSVRKLGRVSEERLRWLYENSAAVLALSYEDFGLTPVEGHTFGKPTIALRAGGYLDTCIEGVNAVFTENLRTESVGRAIAEFRNARFDAAEIRKTAERFTVETFTSSIRGILQDVMR